jgi:hypothetical protein
MAVNLKLDFPFKAVTIKSGGGQIIHRLGQIVFVSSAKQYCKQC